MDNVTFNEEQRAELHAVEAQIKRRVAIGAHVSERRLVDELVRSQDPESGPLLPGSHIRVPVRAGQEIGLAY